MTAALVLKISTVVLMLGLAAKLLPLLIYVYLTTDGFQERVTEDYENDD